jgi:hypothetical protein
MSSVFYIALLGAKKSGIRLEIGCFEGVIFVNSMGWLGPTPSRQKNKRPPKDTIMVSFEGLSYIAFIFDYLPSISSL